MMQIIRRRTAVALATLAFATVACGEATTLPTTLDTTETQLDVAAFEAAFAAPSTESFAALGVAMDNALLDAGGVAIRAPLAMLREGMRRPELRRPGQVASLLASDADPASIPLTARAKTFVWDVVLDVYVESERVGAPVDGVRFVLYTIDESVGLPELPLIEIGYVELRQTSSVQSTAASVEVVGVGGTVLMGYDAVLGGTTDAPSFALDGFAGLGVNRVDFTLNFGYNLITQAIATSWNTSMPGRGLSSRVELTFNDNAYSIGAVMQRGLRKVELTGTISYLFGGTLTVRIGNRIFGTMTFPGDPLAAVIFADAQGQPLTPDEEDTLTAIFDWFARAFDAPDILLSPIYVLLGFDEV